MIPITSSASICSVTRMVPILEVIKDPTLPAMITEIKVGANSNITDCREAKAINFLGIKGLVRLRAVWIATTAPIKNARNTVIPKDPIIKSSISLNIKFRKTEPLVIRLKTPFNIKK